MPMCDAYIPVNALEAEAERNLVSRVSDILVSHEIRRVADLMETPEAVENMRKAAQSISWTFVHRTETYVAGRPIEAPYYRFLASVPEGQLDDRFIPEINRDIMQAVVDAEGGRYPNTERRVWVFAYEVPDGTWGAGGRPLHLKNIIDYVAAGWGADAEARFVEKRRAEAAALVRLAESHQANV